MIQKETLCIIILLTHSLPFLMVVDQNYPLCPMLALYIVCITVRGCAQTGLWQCNCTMQECTHAWCVPIQCTSLPCTSIYGIAVPMILYKNNYLFFFYEMACSIPNQTLVYPKPQFNVMNKQGSLYHT